MKIDTEKTGYCEKVEPFLETGQPIAIGGGVKNTQPQGLR